MLLNQNPKFETNKGPRVECLAGSWFQVPPKSAKGRISLGLRRIRPKPCGGFWFQLLEASYRLKPELKITEGPRVECRGEIPRPATLDTRHFLPLDTCPSSLSNSLSAWSRTWSRSRQGDRSTTRQTTSPPLLEAWRPRHRRRYRPWRTDPIPPRKRHRRQT
jgi:hypothetical protein